jgi:hypothetical protein
LPRSSSLFKSYGDPGSKSRAGPEPPSAQSPFARMALPIRHGYYELMRQSSALRRPRFVALCRGSMQVAVSPCWSEDLPDVISVDLSPDAWTPTPAVPKVHMLVASLETSAFPPFGQGRHPRESVQRLQYGLSFEAAVIRLCSGLQFCLPSRSLPPQRFDPLGGQDVVVWAYLQAVAGSESRPASHPNRAIDGVETCTPPNPQPCRLLPER